jgi:hypothetical protein
VTEFFWLIANFSVFSSALVSILSRKGGGVVSEIIVPDKYLFIITTIQVFIGFIISIFEGELLCAEKLIA